MGRLALAFLAWSGYDKGISCSLSDTASDKGSPLQIMARPNGIGAFFGGVGFILTTPAAWGYAAVPVAMALVLMSGFLYLGWHAAVRLSDWLTGQAGGFASATGGGVTVVLIVISVVLSALAALALAQPLSGWALEAISRQQERKLTGACPPEPSFFRSLWIGVRCSLFIVGIGGTTTLILFTIGLVFPPAVVVTVPLKFLQVAWILAWDLVDYPLGLRGYGIRRRMGWALSNFGAFTMFGAAWAAVLVVPGVFLFILPMGVAGATRLVVASETDDDSPPRVR